jgi:glycogen phosphorylase
VKFRLQKAVSRLVRGLGELSNDPWFMGFVDEMHDDLKRYLESPGWLQLRGETHGEPWLTFRQNLVPSDASPQYSGGLGVPAGDHLKAASGFGGAANWHWPVVSPGHFRQSLTHDGHQQEQ